RRAHRTGQERRLDDRATDRAALGGPERLLHRLDLELALPHLLEVLGRAEEHVEKRAEERREDPERHGHCEKPRILDPAARVLVDPEGRGEPKDDEEEEEDVADDEPDVGVEKVLEASEEVVRVGRRLRQKLHRGHKRIFPTSHPAPNETATIATRTNAASTKTLSRSPTLLMVRERAVGLWSGRRADTRSP